MAVYLPIAGVLLAGGEASSVILPVAIVIGAVAVVLFIAVRFGQKLSRLAAHQSDEVILLTVLGTILLVGGISAVSGVGGHRGFPRRHRRLRADGRTIASIGSAPARLIRGDLFLLLRNGNRPRIAAADDSVRGGSGVDYRRHQNAHGLLGVAPRRLPSPARTSCGGRTGGSGRILHCHRRSGRAKGALARSSVRCLRLVAGDPRPDSRARLEALDRWRSYTCTRLTRALMLHRMLYEIVPAVRAICCASSVASPSEPSKVTSSPGPSCGA